MDDQQVREFVRVKGAEYAVERLQDEEFTSPTTRALFETAFDLLTKLDEAYSAIYKHLKPWTDAPSSPPSSSP